MLLLTGYGNSIDVTDLQEGDIVFIESQSSQAPYIKVGTMSKWTHCGIVVNTSEGLKVLEASKTVRLTPFNTFIGRAKDGNWCVKRPEQKLPEAIKYRKYLGQAYDLEFNSTMERCIVQNLSGKFLWIRASNFASRARSPVS